eukprot:3732650-Pyramimonas_sp.AAC.1
MEKKNDDGQNDNSNYNDHITDATNNVLHMRKIYAVRSHDWKPPPSDHKLRDEWKKMKHAEERRAVAAI